MSAAEELRHPAVRGRTTFAREPEVASAVAEVYEFVEQAAAWRVREHGSHSLRVEELLALLLEARRGVRATLERARALLAEAGDLSRLASSSYDRQRRQRLSKGEATRLEVVFELARRLAKGEVAERKPMGHPAAAASYLVLRFARQDQEVFGALYLDTRNRLIGEQELYRGTLNRAAVEPRRVLQEGLLRNAAGMLVFHNHPSGDPTPSAEDLAFTRRLAEAGEVVGVRLVDHLILGGVGRWVSLAQRGGW
ncbi:MAG: DNA repair protein RadC [Rhodocyclaceae bacterium]|nr:DNA repair protein RadC [Rhodocyclaceae bacterium]